MISPAVYKKYSGLHFSFFSYHTGVHNTSPSDVHCSGEANNVPSSYSANMYSSSVHYSQQQQTAHDGHQQQPQTQQIHPAYQVNKKKTVRHKSQLSLKHMIDLYLHEA